MFEFGAIDVKPEPGVEHSPWRGQRVWSNRNSVPRKAARGHLREPRGVLPGPARRPLVVPPNPEFPPDFRLSSSALAPDFKPGGGVLGCFRVACRSVHAARRSLPPCGGKLVSCHAR
jgi:hypothetical protein